MWENDSLKGLDLPRAKELSSRGRTEVWKWLFISPWHRFWPNACWDPVICRVLPGLHSGSSSLKLNCHLPERGQALSHLANYQSPHLVFYTLYWFYSFSSPKHSAPSPLVVCGWNYNFCSIGAQQSLLTTVSACCVISVRFPGSSVFWKWLAFWLKLEACRCWCILEWSDLMDLEIFWFV